MASTTDAIYDYLAQNCPPGEEVSIVARYRTTEQFRRAWEIIAPEPKRQTECEHRIVYAIFLVKHERDAKTHKKPSLAEEKKSLVRKIKILRAAEETLDDPYLAARLIDEREHTEKELAFLAMAVVQKGKPQRSKRRAAAVHQARKLLLRFSSKQPSLYRDGAWHNLAKVLFGGDARTDLFEYLERYSRPMQWFETTPDGLEPITKEPPLWWLARNVG